jgi:dTDP-4-amino-4,6-dideoxygalactose transaminase
VPHDLEVGAARRLARPSLPELERYLEEIGAVWESGTLSNFAAAAERFELSCAEYTSLANVRAVSSCDIGLTLALRALGLEAGARVLVPSFSFASTLHAVLWNGLEPHFVDVDPDTWCITADSCREAAAEPVHAIVGTHAFMAVCDLDGLERLAAETGAHLLFDAAQAFGTWVGDTHAGAFGDASVFSFSPTKIATCGEGGLAAFRDEAAAARFELLRSYGSDATYDSRFVGLNGKLSELHAALGCLTVPAVEDQVAARLETCERYRARLGDLPGLRLQGAQPAVRNTPTQFVVDLGGARPAVEAALAADGFDTRRYFRPLHAMDRFRDIPSEPLPVTERLGDALLALPLYTGLPDAEVERVCDVVESVLAAAQPPALQSFDG